MKNGSGLPSGLKSVIMWSIGVGIIALTGLIMVILFGNLSGNVGFTSGTAGYNDTQNIITNYTKAVTNTSSQFPTVGTIVGVALLLIILISVLIFAISKLMSVTGATGGSNANFG